MGNPFSGWGWGSFFRVEWGILLWGGVGNPSLGRGGGSFIRVGWGILLLNGVGDPSLWCSGGSFFRVILSTVRFLGNCLVKVWP